MKTILVPLSGGDSDRAVLAAAHAVALPFAAHLDIVHVRIGIADAAKFTPEIGFAQGSGLEAALSKLKTDSDAGAEAAQRHIEAFCGERSIAHVSAPQPSGCVTAQWRMLEHEGAERLIALARGRDLVVMARSMRRLSFDLIERVLLESGRPLLLVPDTWNASALRKIAVWWKDHAAAARSLAAAMPLLGKAGRVILLSAPEGEPGGPKADIASGLGWHGIDAVAMTIPRGRQPASDRLWDASRQEAADLVVMGAFSHSRARELIFGGCTQAVLEAGDLPVLMLH